jgi:hypothetical protein
MQSFDLNKIEEVQTQQPQPEQPQADKIGDLLAIPEAPAPVMDTEPSPEQKDVKPEPTEAERKDLAARNAAMYVTLVDLLVSRGCSLFTGSEIERYKLSKSEKEEYTKVSAEYFFTINAQVSPAAVFLVSTLTIFSSIFFRAWMDFKTKKKKQQDEKKAKERAEAAEAEERNRQQQQQEQDAAEAAQQQQQQQPQQFIRFEPKPEPPQKQKPLYYRDEFHEAKNQRSNFEIYSAEDKPENSKTWIDVLIGKYKRSATNDRWTYEECLKAEDNEPSAIIKMMIGQKQTEGKTWKDINLELRKFLKSLPSFADE